MFKALAASLIAPLAFLKRADATSDTSDILDTVGPYDRLGDTVEPRPEVWVCYNTDKPPVDKPGTFTIGHPGCEYCGGGGTVLECVSGDGFANYKICPACQHALDGFGAKCWYVVTPTPLDYCKLAMRAAKRAAREL